MGDGAGVGPEIIMKSFADINLYKQCEPFVIGDAKILERANDIVQTNLTVNRIDSVNDAKFSCGVVDCIDLNLLPADLPFGKVSSEAGNGAFHYVQKAVELANKGEIEGICTAPLNKEALHKGGHTYPGHTEILAALTGTDEVAMMLSYPTLRVIHVTTHVGLIDAVRLITPERTFEVIRLANETLKREGIERRKIAVCGINPNACENGLCSYGEEEEKIVPDVLPGQSEGIDVEGPLPADTLFF